jgi:ABC-type transport system involved in cytochrome c biogenesis permease subunit
VLTWAVYSFSVFARKRLGWSGRRAAWLSALGFAIILLNFVPVSYFVTTSHTFE